MPAVFRVHGDAHRVRQVVVVVEPCWTETAKGANLEEVALVVVLGMPGMVEKLAGEETKTTDSGALSGLYDAFLFVAVLGFSAVALLALALAAPLALAVSALAGAASAMFAGARSRGGWRSA